MSLGSFYTPWKNQKTSGFLIFSGGDIESGIEWANELMQDVTFLFVAGSGAVDETDFMSAWEEVQDAKVITFFA